MSETKHCDPITVTIVGAGDRGCSYAQYAIDFPDQMKVVAVADPRESKRIRMAKQHGIPDSHVFASWTDLKFRNRLSDAVIIATPDRLHKEPTLYFATKGYAILLEKPMAVTETDCEEIARVVEEKKIIFCVCHVLRYTPIYTTVREMLKTNKIIGELIHIDHVEQIGWFHFAHSYVRGNWSNDRLSTFALMAKGCHDIDLICDWMEGAQCTAVDSFGSLQHFRAAKKPSEAQNAVRCLDCPYERSCCYSAKKIYLESFWRGNNGWPVSVITDQEPSVATIITALRNGPYGKCVYESDNNVVDHQTVTMQFDTGATASYTMIAFTEEISKRRTKFFGSKGELEVDSMGIQHFDFLTRKKTKIIPQTKLPANTRVRGHDGADFFLMQAFVKAVKEQNGELILTNARESLHSHKLVFRAEETRRSRSTVNW